MPMPPGRCVSVTLGMYQYQEDCVKCVILRVSRVLPLDLLHVLCVFLMQSLQWELASVLLLAFLVLQLPVSLVTRTAIRVAAL